MWRNRKSSLHTPTKPTVIFITPQLNINLSTQSCGTVPATDSIVLCSVGGFEKIRLCATNHFTSVRQLFTASLKWPSWLQTSLCSSSSK
mmetsp:Transcript_10551/g.15549  ORF Transcript_10551/g.15549 Transcript_10551/m.15549 type:complete len:89 (-) Transcript_10551:104-370(-)